MAAGDFSASNIVSSILKADALWGDETMRPNFMAEVQGALAIMQEQTANVQLINAGGEASALGRTTDADLVVTWVKSCCSSLDVTDLTDDCDISGPEAESVSATYSLGFVKKIGFTVKEKLGRTNVVDMEMVVAREMLQKAKCLDEYIAETLISKLESFKGVNQFLSGYATTGGDTDIPAAQWIAQLLGYFILAGKINKFSNPFLLSGTSLFLENWAALLDQANADGRGEAAKFNALRKYYDVFNVDSVNNPDLKAYLIDSGAVAFAHRNFYDATPIDFNLGANQRRWSIESRNLPGVRYDVHYTNECSSNDILHKYILIARFDYFINPLIHTCEDDISGVLAFKQVP